MKLIVATQILLTCLIPSTALLVSQSAQAQLPAIEDTNQLTTTSPAPANSPAPEATNNASEVITASAAALKVSCQDSKTVVQKGDRQAVMVTWKYDGFGKEFTAEKRCQVVSERLQQAANLNGGTFKDLQLSSGTVNSAPVICTLQANSKKCSKENMLFTLKPENARNPEAVIQKIFGFAQDGSSDLNESASSKPKTDMSLGKWEQNAFARSGKSAPVKHSNTSPKPKPKTTSNTGF
jgi:Circadian oscillating protein COP23